MTLPFDGAITEFFETGAPDDVRDKIANADKDDILSPDYPYSEKLKRKTYEKDMAALQIELVKMQAWLKASGHRVALVFEGRDAAGKGGTIKRFRENLNPRGARVVALSKPSDTERTQWYFQRYAAHLPSAGETVLFDRSWYNRAGVEPVMGFCTPEQHGNFLREAPDFERMLTDDGIVLIKFWLNIGRPMQMKRFHDRRHNPLKQWKLSPIDLKSLTKWDEYGVARDEMLRATHTEFAPWTVVRANDKRRSRISVIGSVLNRVDYHGKDPGPFANLDPRIVMSAPDFLQKFGQDE